MEWFDNIVLQAPEYLWAILAVPLLWWLLRLIPPEAIRRRFPSLKLFQNLPPLRAQTAFTPVWLLILRGILIIFLVVAFTEPVLQLEETELPPSDQPVIILVDNCWTTTPNWDAMRTKALSLLSSMPLEQNIAVLAACPVDANYVITRGLVNTPQARILLHQLPQQNKIADWKKIIAALQNLDLAPIAQLNVISSGVMNDADSMERLVRELRVYDEAILSQPPADHLPLQLEIKNDRENLTAHISRLTSKTQETHTIEMRNRRGNVVSLMTFNFAEGATTHELDLPILAEEKNDIGGFRIQSMGMLAEAPWQSSQLPARVGIVNSNQPTGLDQPQTYLEHALSGRTQVISDNWKILLAQNLPVIITADPELPRTELTQIYDWVNHGGRLIRFAKSELPVQTDDLMPSAPLRIMHSDPDYLLQPENARMQLLPAQSPLTHIAIPAEFHSYWLMSPILNAETSVWASYNNGAPMILARNAGKGKSIFVTATPSPQSGNWITQPGFPELIRTLLTADTMQPAPEAQAEIDFAELAQFDEGGLSENVRVSDLAAVSSGIPLQPYLLLLAALLFIIDQALILVRFSGILWVRS